MRCRDRQGVVARRRLVAGFGALALACAAGASELADLRDPARAPGDLAAHALAAGGGRVVLGSPGAGATRGAVVSFDCSLGTCVGEPRFAPLDLADGAAFGAALALAGDTLAVGAPGAGATYVYTRGPGGWMQQARLVAAGAGPGERFGSAVALAGDTLLVGAPGRADARGAAYVFLRVGSAWTQQTRLEAADGEARDRFGHAVALEGTTALIGAPFEADEAPGTNHARGAAYVFVGAGAIWSQQAKLTRVGASKGDVFGFALALRGDRALVGAPYAAAGEGRGYIFERMGVAWAQTATLASPGVAGDLLGFSVALAPDRALLGAPFASAPTGAGCGRSASFTAVAAAWGETAPSTPRHYGRGDFTGFAVALDGTRSVVGAPGDAQSTAIGRALVFDPAITLTTDSFESPPADCVDAG